jgi:hypothetical protein
MIAENDFHDLPSVIAADAVFRYPVGLKPYPGRELVCLMLSTAAGIFEDFKYHRKFLNGESDALEFGTGEFVEIEKLVRPMEGAKELAMASSIGLQIKALRAAA